MAYTVHLTSKAKRQLKRLSRQFKKQVQQAIDSLALDPRPPGCKKLTDREEYRIRSGNFRIIYTIQDNDLIVVVIAVGDRKSIY